MQERRQSFRVEDQAAIWLARADHEAPQHPIPPSFDQHGTLSVLEQLKTLEQQSHHLLGQLGGQDPALAHYLKNLNQRFELLGQLVLRQQSPSDSQVLPISLSADGFSCELAPLALAFRPQPGDLLELKMLLQPDSLLLTCYADVVYLEPQGVERLGVRFRQLPESQHCRLQRRLFERQSAILQAPDSLALEGPGR